MRVRPLARGTLLLLVAGVSVGVFSLAFTRVAKSYGGPHAASAPSQVSYPIPVGSPVTTEVYEIIDMSPANKEQIRTWLDAQAKSSRELVAVVSRSATEKPLFVFVYGRGNVRPLVISSPDLSKENVLARIREQGPQRRFVGSYRAGKANLLFFQ
jgi:hypothetical protein